MIPTKTTPGAGFWVAVMLAALISAALVGAAVLILKGART